MNKDIEQAIDGFRRAAGKYSRSERYYSGDHDLTFATEKFQNAFGSLFREFAMNLCPAIVDAVKDKLRLSGFRVGRVSGVAELGKQEKVSDRPPRHRSGATTPPNLGGELFSNSANFVDSVNSATRAIWHGNRMGQRAGEIHKEALKNGDAYAVVWFDPRGEVTIYPQRAGSVTVAYDEDSPGRIAWAAKYWRTGDRRVRLNLFYPDRIERYVSRNEAEALSDTADLVPFGERERTTPSAKRGHPSFVRRGASEAGKLGTRNLEPATIPNPFGVVPVFHFANNADIGALGQSELTAAMPIQDGLNKSVLDMLVAMEFSAFRQRWIAGLDVVTDPATGKPTAPFEAGVERLWVATSSDTKFGDFNSANLDQFLRVKDGFRIDMASVTGTPLHYFLQNTRGFASGEALRKNEMRFLAKIRDRQTAFGQVWADLMAFAVRLAGGPAGIELMTDWEDPAPLDEKDFLANLLLKKEIGISTEQALVEIGYGDEVGSQ